MSRTLVMILVGLIGYSLACNTEPSSVSDIGAVIRITKPAALVLNELTTKVIQAAFRHASYPDIKGEKYVRFLGGVTYGLTDIHIDDLSIESSEVYFKENDAISLGIQNVSASFRGTLSYGYMGAWLVKLIYSIPFEIDSSIDLQLNTRLTCEKERVLADTSDCYLTFHKLALHLYGDRNPGWLKQLFTDFISLTLQLVLKHQVCKEINYLAQLLAEFIQETAEHFVRDADIGLDLGVKSDPVITANYIESYHKGLLLYKNYSGVLGNTAFLPSLLSESRMLYFWFSERVLKSLVLATFLDKRLVLTIAGDELQEMFESKELGTYQETVQEIFQDVSYNDSLAKVWSLTPPQIALQPEGTVVKSYVAVEFNVSSHGGEPFMALYIEKDITVTIQASYGQKNLALHLTNAAVIEPKMFKCSSDKTVSDDVLNHMLEKIILVAGIPKVISKIATSLTALLDRNGLGLFNIKDPEIITREASEDDSALPCGQVAENAQQHRLMFRPALSMGGSGQSSKSHFSVEDTGEILHRTAGLWFLRAVAHRFSEEVPIERSSSEESTSESRACPRPVECCS